MKLLISPFSKSRPLLSRIHTRALLATLAATCFAVTPASAERRWEMTGTLNFVQSSLSGTFSRNQTFNITLDMDEDAPLNFGERISFFTSNGTYGQAVSNATVSFSNYTATFASQPDTTNSAGGTTFGDGGLQVRNTESDSFGFDQLNMNFSRSQGGIVSAPQVAGLDLESIEFNFFSDSSPLNMIEGTGAGFPAIDVPFPGPGTFNLARTTNSANHFVLRFSGGTPAGTIFVRGSIDSLVFSEVGGGGGGFADWPALATAPEGQRGANDTPAGDGVANIIKYALGVSPLESANARLPSKVVEGQGGDTGFPTVSFIRIKDLAGALIEVEVSADLDFSNDLGSTVIDTEDLGNGTERVTIRSNASFSSQTKQFFRLKVSEN